jgi:hypothetical protein
MFVAEDDICKPEVHCRTAPPADAQAVYEGSAPRVDFGGIREKAATVLANRPAIASIPQVQAFMQRASAREPADVGPRSVAAPVRVDMAGARLRVPDTVRVAADDFRSQADPARRQAAACAAAARLPAPVPRAGRPSVAAPDSHIDSPGRAIQLATRPAAAPSGGAAPSGRRAAAAAAEGVAARQAVHAVAASGRGQAVRDRIENGW